LTSLSYVVETALVLGDRARLDRHYPTLAHFEGTLPDFLVDRHLGHIEVLRGNLDRAREHLRAAEAVARREGLRMELARTLEGQADVALAQGGPGSAAAAHALLAEAVAEWEHVGNRVEVRRLRERMRALARGVHPRVTLPAGLSAREAEVLRLLAAGRTNREIAAQLYLSEKTVENHVTSIYGKIGADNRAGATAYAVRLGLA
ncbi:MAG TPA: response regulator transcription factor, partial [Candidatus Binatia bacterium]|nr:response regulator transcription factor [Candidatus Binatia bacterium]